MRARQFCLQAFIIPLSVLIVSSLRHPSPSPKKFGSLRGMKQRSASSPSRRMVTSWPQG